MSLSVSPGMTPTTRHIRFSPPFDVQLSMTMFAGMKRRTLSSKMSSWRSLNSAVLAVMSNT